MNDVWELAKRIFLDKCDYHNSLSDKQLREIFQTRDVAYILNTNTPQEALAKIKEYETSRLINGYMEKQTVTRAGDVVENDHDEKAAVLDETESYFSVFTENGSAQEWLKDICNKTGRHIDIESVLKQIGGQV